jgi:electron transfer flavoprotein beta subunit
MKIIVALKEVPVRDAPVRIAPGERWIDESDLSFEMNEPDAYALEAGLVLKERHGGEVIALCAGPERASGILREALAKGADRALHVVCDDLSSVDSLTVAGRLAAAILPEPPDLVLTGLQSDDVGLGQTGVLLAELLGFSHATIVMEIEAHDGSLRVRRELEDGWFQWIEMPMPAVLTIQSGVSKLRYATLMGIKKSKSKEIRKLSPEVEPVAPSVVLERVYLPPRKKSARMISGAPTEVAAELVNILRYEVRVV